MNREMIPWFEPSLDDSDAAAVRRAVDEGYVNEGPRNRAFEETLKEYFQVAYALTTPSGTTALALSLMAAGIGHGDTVLIPDITFIGTASAVRLAGAEPILVDVNPRTFNMDPDDARRRLASSTKAVIGVHLNGRSAELQTLQDLCRERGLSLIEDAAEALACRAGGQYLGTLGDAGCFSLAPTKIITSGQGGFVLTQRRDIYETIVRLKDHGRLSRQSDLHPQTGFNFKVTDLQGALAQSQWSKLEQRIERVKSIDRMYVGGLRDLHDLSFPPRPGAGGYLMWPDFKSPRREGLTDYLRDHAIQVRPVWPALHTQPAYASNGHYPGANEVSREGCWLPCSPAITDPEVHIVIERIRAFFLDSR